MRTLLLSAAVAAVSTFTLVGCGGARSIAGWQDDTQKMLEPSNAAIKSCYDAALQKDRKLAGSVVITFEVERDTGHVKNANVDAARTTGGEALTKCIIDNIQDLKMDPPDPNQGEATFTWTFNSTAAAPAPADAAATADAPAT